jgi:hypothetical protein
MQCCPDNLVAVSFIKGDRTKTAKKKLTGFPVSYTNYHNNLAIG